MNIFRDSDRQCAFARDSARCYLRVAQLSIPSQPASNHCLDPRRSPDPDIGLSEACREVSSLRNGRLRMSGEGAEDESLT